MKNSPRIVLIGSGNVATVLGHALKHKKFTIAQVFSRSKVSAKKLSVLLGCPFTDDLKKITHEADLYIIAVKDDAIREIASSIRLKGKEVVHTSGSVAMDVLKKISDHYGVLYPAHGFNRKESLVKNIPFCIEFSSPKIRQHLEYIVKELGGKIYYMNSAQRATLHLAAVFANNFTNHLWVMADKIVSDSHVPYDILVHLIEDNNGKLKHGHPVQHQTGPAIRRDKKVMKQHEAMLKNYPASFGAAYKILSKSIQENE